MVKRDFWLRKIAELWKKRNVVWLSGIRRAGKTSLCHSLPGVVYYDCELPSVRRMLSDVESFLESHRGKKLVLDEIHRLDNPSELLKLATDHFQDIRIIATGSSVLGASAKFRDTLAGRKAELWLTPMISKDLEDFQQTDLHHRLLRGGLPPFFLDGRLPEKDFQEWMDAFWAKDIQELFRLERRHSFQKFTELLLTQSGGIFEATRFAKPCEVSRGTISNYLAVLEATFVAHVIRPFSKHGPTEIVSAPKVYGFDTGFIAYHKGWRDLRGEDLGLLWEHYVLNEIHGRMQMRDINYWRDKSHHEVDFVVARRGEEPIAIECKWSADEFTPNGLLAFRKQHPKGRNFVVAENVAKAFTRKYGETSVRFSGLEDLLGSLSRRTG
jgi:uncharacterized protein